MSERGLRFGTVAAAYERYRPGYPPDMADKILAYASPPVSSAIEIGAGTGKATRLFTDRGIAVTAVEPDPDMLAVLHQGIPAASPVQSTLESLELPATFDLLYAAAAWHWTHPATRWQQAATLIRSGGTAAFFGGPIRIADHQLRQAVVDARRTIVVDDEIRPPGKSSSNGIKWPGSEILDSELFTDVEQHEVPRSITVPAADYLGNLSTVSAYLVLTTADRDEVLRRIAVVLPAEVELRLDITLHLARRT